MREFKDLHPAMKEFVISRLIAGGAITLAVFIITSALLSLKTGAIVFLLGLAYILYVLILLLSFLRGKGDMYEGVVIQDTAPVDTKRTRIKDGMRLVQEHTTRTPLRIRTLADDKILEIRLKGREQYKVGNKITIFTPSNSAFRKASDFFIINDYYKIVKDFEDIDDYIKSLEADESTSPTTTGEIEEI